jgi:hypothetical protein
MVTRNAPYEKREHALSFTFKSAGGRLDRGEAPRRPVSRQAEKL